jgi:hypothetical protein
MHCPRLTELPPPPEGKTGRQWTVETPPVPSTRLDGSPWARISIVTPRYNQGQLIEEAIRSFLLQDYPDLGYIIIDGGPTDGALDQTLLFCGGHYHNARSKLEELRIR